MEQLANLKRLLMERLPRYEIMADEPLSKHTSFRIGGRAELMVFPHNREDLKTALLCAAEIGIVPRILGAGTNVLAPDAGVRGLVICLRDTFMGLQLLDRTHILAMSGMTLAQTAMFAMRDGLSGLEFAHGIPGTVGGAIYMNAGAYGGEMRDVAVETEFMHMDGTLESFAGERQALGYRTSVFQSMRGVIVSVKLELKPGEPSDIRARIHELAQKRRDAQPLEMPSAGSAFKRPKQGYAAALIEQAGLKGFCVGGAAVSEKHAGFIVNLGGATAADVLRLIDAVRERVLQTSGIELEPEIRLWSEDELR